MSIAINKGLCVGCGKCQKVCPGNLIKSDEKKKAYIKFPKSCWGCASCVKECKVDAIKFYLGADMGGLGSTLSIKGEGDITHWIIKKDKEEIVIDVNKKNANAY
ncbi:MULTISPECIES: 4Fe-4S binding protein [Clostridium]|uniref:4Fe-4S binding protein n=1 Tax=Clostridium cibarium TaxID=2762247 RepID=A0ABR8PT28_9CLOT|nr:MULTISPECIES: 4Fe-4S binding protein [Clostridium]MBD7911322.1 4Fe-4S binding protein [Clostridium cibarium]